MKIDKTTPIPIEEKDISFGGDAMKLIRPTMFGISIGWNTAKLIETIYLSGFRKLSHSNWLASWLKGKIMYKTLITAVIGGKTDVYVCEACGEFFSVIAWPNSTNGEPEENNHPYIKCCPICGCGTYDKTTTEKPEFPTYTDSQGREHEEF